MARIERDRYTVRGARAACAVEGPGSGNAVASRASREALGTYGSRMGTEL